ncbi:hypothetical protein B7H01_01875 [Pandoraea apista]|nr:hypothetical protein B7H01_01875 [Pandoraea apista]
MGTSSLRPLPQILTKNERTSIVTEGGYKGFDLWFSTDLNNAKIGSFATYNQWVPAFMALLARQHGDLPKFYAAVKAMSKRPEAERNEALAVLDKTPEAAMARASLERPMQAGR